MIDRLRNGSETELIIPYRVWIAVLLHGYASVLQLLTTGLLHCINISCIYRTLQKNRISTLPPEIFKDLGLVKEM